MKLLLTKLLLICAVVNCFGQSKSKIETVEKFKSDFVKTRKVEIWLPAEYASEPKRKFPVLYMQDGQNIFNAETATNKTAWEADNTAAKMITANVIEPVIIVAIWNTDLRYLEYFPDKAAANFTADDTAQIEKVKKISNISETEYLGDEYLKFLTQELKPYIDKKYRTLPDAANTSICGSSMGGIISIYAICEYPDVFGQAACISTHWPLLIDNSHGGPANALKQYLYEKLPAPKNHRIYYDHGTATMDRFYEMHQKSIDNMMRLKGYELNKNWHTRKFENAAHNEIAWQSRFDQVLQFLYRPEIYAKKEASK